MSKLSDKWDKRERSLELSTVVRANRSNRAIDALEGIAAFARSPEALAKLLTVTGPDGKPLLLRLEEA